MYSQAVAESNRVQVHRAMLADPTRRWRQNDLAQATGGKLPAVRASLQSLIRAGLVRRFAYIQTGTHDQVFYLVVPGARPLLPEEQGGRRPPPPTWVTTFECLDMSETAEQRHLPQRQPGWTPQHHAAVPREREEQ